MCLCCPATNPWAVRGLKAPKNAGGNVMKVSPPNIARPAVEVALPRNRAAATVNMVNPPSRAAVSEKKAKAPKHVIVIGRSPRNKIVDSVRARSDGMVGPSK